MRLFFFSALAAILLWFAAPAPASATDAQCPQKSLPSAYQPCKLDCPNIDFSEYKTVFGVDGCYYEVKYFYRKCNDYCEVYVGDITRLSPQERCKNQPLSQILPAAVNAAVFAAAAMFNECCPLPGEPCRDTWRVLTSPCMSYTENIFSPNGVWAVCDTENCCATLYRMCTELKDGVWITTLYKIGLERSSQCIPINPSAECFPTCEW